MDFLRKLFGGGGGSTTPGDPNGLYFYVKPDGCDEVVRVRVNRNNDLSLADDGKNYWVRKVVQGTKCFHSADLTLYFNSGHQLTNSEINGGALVKAEDYQSWLESQALT